MTGRTKHLVFRNISSSLLSAFGIFFLSAHLAALETSDSLEVYTKGTAESHYLKTFRLNGRNYCDLEEIASLFHANLKEERADKRIYLNLYDEQFIFLTFTPYFSFKNEDYQLSAPLLSNRNRVYVSLEFVTDFLPVLFKDKVSFAKGKITIAKPQNNTIQTIVLDPGHGGRDPGAVGRTIGAYEKTINLNVALMLKTLLEQELNVRVMLTRPDDRFVSLQDRTKFANENKADLFISIHTNASRDRSSRGIEMYYLSTSKTTESRAVEALENSVVELYEGGKAALEKYDDLALILSDILQAENLEQSNNLALKLQMNICAGTKSPNRGVRQANFYVLRGAFMPAVLIEMGFISHPAEEAYLVNRQYEERLSRTIFEGIKSFKYRYDRIRTS